ncbi:hypothetical protein [Natrinema salinisoli]|nr:hypothetical protein [Natrinema salinisoli]
MSAKSPRNGPALDRSEVSNARGFGAALEELLSVLRRHEGPILI